MTDALVKSADWISSKGARTIQFTKTHGLEQPGYKGDTVYQEVITLKQSCIGKTVSIAVERRNDRGDGVFLFAGNPYAGISLEPHEWQQIIQAMQELQK